MSGCSIYAGDSNYNGLRIRGVASLSRSAAWSWTFLNLYCEGQETEENEFMTITGSGHTFINSVIYTTETGLGYINWEADHCFVSNNSTINVGNGTVPVLRISGDHNYFGSMVFGSVVRNPWQDYNPVQDTGNGNRVSRGRVANVDDNRSKEVAMNIARDGILGIRAADFLSTVPSTPYTNSNDLWIWPNEMNWEGSPKPTITKDSKLISGQYAVVASPGSNYVNFFSQQRISVGYEVPASHAMVYVAIKAATIAASQWAVVQLNGSTTVGAVGMNVTTDWTVQGCPIDCTGATAGDYIQFLFVNPSVEQDIHIAWIAIVPMHQWFYGFERSADPPQPIEGQFVVWMSDGNGYGDDGDIMIASTAGGVTNYGTVFDHSAGSAW
jgi:hypothetical protein